MKKVLFTLIGVLGMCLGLTFNMHDTVHAANPATVDNNVSATYTGWVTNDDGTYSYYENGEIVCSEVLKIGNAYYGFDYEGIMYADAQFEIYSSEDGEYKYYCAKEDGTLYCDSWYETEWGTWYYYSSEGCAVKGYNTIKGLTYYFYFDGMMLQNAATSTEKGNIVADRDGIIKELANNRWTQVDSYWYYVKDNQIARHEVMLISGQYYVFDSWGRMHTNNEYLFDNNTDYRTFYRAKADGTLCRNEWYHYDGTGGGTWFYYDDDTWFYYGDDCKAYKGFHNIGGKTYYFDEYAAMLSNEAFTVDGVNYVAASDGVVTKLNNNRWTQVGSYWYYVKDNEILMDEVAIIGGEYYYFDYSGRMIENDTYTTYIAGERVGYGAKAGGALYRNQWYQDKYGNWYYFDSDCKMAFGLKSINGSLYYFGSSSGQMWTNSTVEVNGTYYAIKKSGVCVQLENNKWTYVDGEWYYIKDGEIPYNEILNISGNYYAFDWNGAMRSDESFSCGDYYRAKTNGVLYRNEWYEDKWGGRYYYGNDCAGVEGIHEIGNTQYYFEYDGRLMVTGYAYSNDGVYLIGKEGALVTNNKGWYYYNSEWYYMNENGTLYSGILTKGNVQYYLDYEMYHNTGFINVDGVLYQAKDGTGALTKVTSNGFHKDAYSVYYVKNGKTVTGWEYIDGWRYFDSYGEMVSDNTYYYIDGAYYAFDYNGVMYSNTWINGNSYATSSGAFATGEYVINGKKYYFDSWGNLDNSVYASNDKVYIEGVTYTFKNGWNQVGSNWYYLYGGELAYGAMNIGGKWYYFDYQDHTMQTDYIFNRIYGADGVAIKGWYSYDGYWYYAGEDYYLANGLTEIKGVKYYFRNGCMLTADYLDDDCIYTIGSDGIVKKVSQIKDGWNYVGNKAYYIKDGDKYTGWLGESYIEYGQKVYDMVVYDSKNGGEYYIDKSGNCAYNTWIKGIAAGHMPYNSYAGADGKIKVYEWAYINGDWYYFDENSFCTGILEENGVTYYLNEQGKLIKTYKTITDGWHYMDGNWLYAYNGKFVRNCSMYIGGNYYYFDYSGKMVSDAFAYGRYYGQDGKLKDILGWKYIQNDWYYFGEDGKYVWNEWLNIGGKKYYVSGSGKMYTGYKVIEDKLYYFDDQGVCKGTREVANGWYCADGDWYYFKDNCVVTSQVIFINGVRYAFDYDGKMLTNIVAYDNNNILHYFGTDGAAVTKSGIYKTSDGGRVYVGSDGSAYLGEVYIDGKIQYMDAGWWYLY